MATRFQRAAHDGRPALNRGKGPTVGGVTNEHRVDERVHRASSYSTRSTDRAWNALESPDRGSGLLPPDRADCDEHKRTGGLSNEQRDGAAR